MKKYLILIAALTLTLRAADVDIDVMRASLRGFIRESTTVVPTKMDEFIRQKSIKDIPRFKAQIEMLIPGMVEEKTIMSESILERISTAQCVFKVNVQSRLRELSFLDTKSDRYMEWFHPCYEDGNSKQHDAKRKLTPQECLFFDFCAYSLFAPVKLIKIQSIQKLSTTQEILDIAYLSYQAEVPIALRVATQVAPQVGRPLEETK